MPEQTYFQTRRRVLKVAGSALVAGAVNVLVGAGPTLAAYIGQPSWRFCNKCHAMFYDGYPNKGHCPGGGSHVAQGYTFVLPHDVHATSHTQDQWRFCNKCANMFFNGYDDKGRCAVGGAHVAQGYNFVLPHDVPPTAEAQDDWRFCYKCKAMFYDGYPDKGKCAAGGAHVAQGYMFVLPHPVYSCAHCTDGSCQCGYLGPGGLCAGHGREDPEIGCSQSH